MQNQVSDSNDEEISLLDLFSVLLKYKSLIIGVSLGGMIFSLAFSVISLVLPVEKSYMKNEYTPKALMLINDSSSSGGSLSSLLSSSSSLSSLASLAGISALSGSTYSSLAVYLVGTNDFLDSVVDRFDLITRYKVKKAPRASSRKALLKKIMADFDSESGVLSISFTDHDPVFAQSVVNYSVSWLEKRFLEMGLDKNKLAKENLEINIRNSYEEILKLEKENQSLMNSVASGKQLPGGSSVMLESKRLELELNAQQTVYSQLRTQYELLKVQMASETPVFQILENADVPDKKSGPSRGMLCIVVSFASFFFAVFLAFLLNAIDNIKKDPEAMAKLRGVKE